MRSVARTPSPPAAVESGDHDPADFGAGLAGEGIHIAATSHGAEVILEPKVVADFLGEALPPDWFVEEWKEGGQAELVEEGLRLHGTRAGYAKVFGADRSLEFVATFNKRPHQHVGFGTNFRDVPWVSFSTKFGHSLYARSHFFIAEDSRLSASYLGSPHRFRIDWNVIDVEYWIDGERVAHQLAPIVGYMRPLASNGSLGDGPVVVEWMRMSPYRPEGTFTSRVHDAGAPALWVACEFDVDLPPGTVLVAEVRAGDAPEPDRGWSDWALVAGPLCLRGRFAQYRIRLTTTDPSQTPVVRGVSLLYSVAAGSDGGGPGSSSSGSS